jgi:outer membrane protein assembly factor BamB/tetratricopeptide (TPR) repeat protein
MPSLNSSLLNKEFVPMETKKLFSFFAFLLLSISLFSQTPGTRKWDYLTGGAVGSSPAIGADGTIYIGSNDQKLYAINPNGTKKWEYLLANGFYSSPVIGVDGTIYLGLLDSKLYAINPDGTKKWDYLTGGNISRNAAIATDGTIYIGSYDNNLHAINPDGTPKWQFYTGDWITSSPAIGAAGEIYVCSWDIFFAINPDGTEKWEYLIGDILNSSPSIGSDGTIYVGSNDTKLYAFNPDGTKKWDFITGGSIYSSPATGNDGTIYIASDDNKLYAINPDGTKKWEFLTGYGIGSSPAIGADGTIYIGSDDDKLYAINPDGTKKWDYLTGFQVTSSPAIGTDGTIYFGSNDSKIYALFSESEGLANSSWPKYQHDNFNRSQLLSLGVDSADFSNMVLPNQGYNFKVKFISTFESNITITNVQINDTDFGLLTSLPITIIPGARQEVSLSLAEPQNKWYKPTLSIDYSLGGTDFTKTINLEGIIFLDDNTELAHTANQVMRVWKNLDKTNEVMLNNTKGVIYRLLSDYPSAENSFNMALNSALKARYGYSGIMMNTGVVKSDRLLPDSAVVFYTNALAAIQQTASSSVLAPQIYYNQAWEAYMNANYNDAAALAFVTINHSMANEYLKAKAYTLLGVVRYAQEKISEAVDAFEQAVALDKDGPVGNIAQANMYEIIGTGVDQNTVGPEIKLYPNPSDGKIQFSTGNLTGNYDVSVFNNTGEKVFTCQFASSAYTYQNLDISHLVDGVYVIRITSDDMVFTKKIAIIKK